MMPKKISKIFKKGTEIEDIMDFPHDNIKWNKWEEKTVEDVKITIEKLRKVI